MSSVQKVRKEEKDICRFIRIFDRGEFKRGLQIENRFYHLIGNGSIKIIYLRKKGLKILRELTDDEIVMLDSRLIQKQKTFIKAAKIEQ